MITVATNHGTCHYTSTDMRANYERYADLAWIMWCDDREDIEFWDIMRRVFERLINYALTAQALIDENEQND